MSASLELSKSDRVHLDAAEGWFGLGNWQEANEELELIAPERRVHPEVLRLRCEIYAKVGKWEFVAEIAATICVLVPGQPFGFIRCAEALHKLKRTREALNVLVPVVDQFSNEIGIFYNLACYYCALGELKNAFYWLALAIDSSEGKAIKLRALDEPDLKDLWLQISEI